MGVRVSLAYSQLENCFLLPRFDLFNHNTGIAYERVRERMAIYLASKKTNSRKQIHKTIEFDATQALPSNHNSNPCPDQS